MKLYIYVICCPLGPADGHQGAAGRPVRGGDRWHGGGLAQVVPAVQQTSKGPYRSCAALSDITNVVGYMFG